MGPALAKKEERGSPSIRIACIDDPTLAYARGGGFEIVGQKLRKLAESCTVHFEFLVAAITKNKLTLLGKKSSIARSNPKQGKKESVSFTAAGGHEDASNQSGIDGSF